MFFLTQIKKADTFSAVDVAGRRLTFAANLPCQAGDFVWTDGRVIFGDVQSKDTPRFFFDDSKSGVPYVGNLRGYFDDFGYFNNFNVFQDSWLVNDDKNFAHGNSNIYDAEFSFDGDLLTAELVSNSLINVYKNGKLFYSVDANSLADSNFITDSSVSATYNAEFINFKLLRDGTYEALVEPVATVTVDSGSSGDGSSDSQSVVFNELLTRAEFLAADFPFEHSEYGGHPLFKKAILTFWELCLFADYSISSDTIVYKDRGFYRSDYIYNGQISKIQVQIFQSSQDSDSSATTTFNITGGISRVSNGTVTAKKNPVAQSFISGVGKGSFGETAPDDYSGNFFDSTSAIGTVMFVDGGILRQQTRVKDFLIDDTTERIWRDPNGRSIPLQLFYCPFTSYNDSNADFFFYESSNVAPFDDTFADDIFGLSYKFRLVYDLTIDDSNTTITTPPFLLAIAGKYKYFTRSIIDPSGGGGGSGGSGDSTQYLQFPVQDGFYFDEQFHAVFDSDSNIIFANDNFSIQDKLSATSLKRGGFLVGKKNSALFLVNDNQIQQSFDYCNNFRLRRINNISITKK